MKVIHYDRAGKVTRVDGLDVEDIDPGPDLATQVAELRARADAADQRLDAVAQLAEQASVTAQEVAQAARRPTEGRP